MTDADRYSGQPGDLTEQEALARLSVEEKATIALPAIVDFPHLTHEMLDNWLRATETETTVPAAASEHIKAEALVDALRCDVESGDDPEALDRFIFGYLYPANLENLGIDPDDVAGRDPLDEWDGVYEDP